MDQEKFFQWFGPGGRAGVLSTADEEGRSNAAVFGSAWMPDPASFGLALAENRSLSNLRVNPRAVFTVFEPSPSPLAWQGARLYLEVDRIEGEGPLLHSLREEVGRRAGAAAARRIRAAVLFRVTALRPLIDLAT